MPVWYYNKSELKTTPSTVDGLDADVEQRYRREGARFIINVGTRMGLRYDTMATGVVYFHRFYMFHSFRTFPRFVTACCCLFLAGKVEETPKKCKDIIKTARALLTDQQFTQFGDDPKEEVMTLERILLQTIKFDLQVDHPYGYLLRYAKSLRGEKTKLQKMVQMAWTFVNDSLCTTLCLQWEPEIIGIALMYLAGKLSKFEITDWSGRTAKHVRWWDMFVDDMSIELLEDICHQVLDLYSTPLATTPQDSPPSTPPTVKAQKIQTTPPAQSLPPTPPQTKAKEPVPLPTTPVELVPVAEALPPQAAPIPTIITVATVQSIQQIQSIQPTERIETKQHVPPLAPRCTSPPNNIVVSKPLLPPPMPPAIQTMVTEAEQPSRMMPIPPPPPPPYNFPVKPPLPVDEPTFPTSFGAPPPNFQSNASFQASFAQGGKNPISPLPSYPSGPSPGPPPVQMHPSGQYGSYGQHSQYFPGNESQQEYYPPVQPQNTSGFPQFTRPPVNTRPPYTQNQFARPPYNQAPFTRPPVNARPQFNQNQFTRPPYNQTQFNRPPGYPGQGPFPRPP